MLWKEFILAVAVSIDSLGIGVTYEMKRIKIPLFAKGIVAVLTATIMFLSLQLGEWMKEYFPGDVLQILGNAIMVFIGLWFIRKSLVPNEGLSVDNNHSSIIEKGEACLLALLLSIDTIGIGAAYAAVSKGSLFLVILSGVMQVVFLTLGAWIARKSILAFSANERFCGVCSGAILILLALVRSLP